MADPAPRRRRPSAALGAVFAATLTLAGCGATPVGTAPGAVTAGAAAPVQPDAASLSPCQGAPYVRLVGQDATALERELILRQVRLIRPDRPVTADYRAERLNFTIDAAGRIARVSCG